MRLQKYNIPEKTICSFKDCQKSATARYLNRMVCSLHYRICREINKIKREKGDEE